MYHVLVVQKDQESLMHKCAKYFYWKGLGNFLSAQIHPYDVIIMKHGEFYDLKGFEKTLNSNTTKNTKNEPVQWLKIMWLRLQKESPTSIFYKYDLTDPDFKEIDICKTKTMKKNKDMYKQTKETSERSI